MSEKNILLVEDEEDLLELYKSFLESEGHIIEKATKGQEAVNKAEKKKFDMVILDIKLPDIMGDEVAKALKAINKNIIIIMVTGFPSFQESIDALDLGIYDILLKPITADELLRVVRDAFSTSG
jgi:two-component system alkaline phosphatase synthesis response regulator PhoP